MPRSRSPVLRRPASNVLRRPAQQQPPPSILQEIHHTPYTNYHLVPVHLATTLCLQGSEPTHPSIEFHIASPYNDPQQRNSHTYKKPLKVHFELLRECTRSDPNYRTYTCHLNPPDHPQRHMAYAKLLLISLHPITYWHPTYPFAPLQQPLHLDHTTWADYDAHHLDHDSQNNHLHNIILLPRRLHEHITHNKHDWQLQAPSSGWPFPAPSRCPTEPAPRAPA